MHYNGNRSVRVPPFQDQILSFAQKRRMEIYSVQSWTLSYVPQLTDIEEQLETDSIPIKEEEEEDLPEDIDESEQSSEKEEKPTMPFGDFLDLMEVF